MTETGFAAVVKWSKNENSPLYGDGSNGPTALSNFLRIEIFRCWRVRKNAFIDSAFEVAQPLHLRKKKLTASAFGATQALYLRKNAFTPSVITNYFSQTPFQSASRLRTHRASPAYNDLKNRETSGQLPHRSQVLSSSGNQRYP